jgi:ferredoxin
MPRSRFFIWLLKKGFPLRSVFARFTKVPLLGRMMDYMLFHEDDILYLPKDEVTTIKINQQIEQNGSMVIPSKVIDYFIEKANYHWIMDWCICRSASSCKHYPIELGCLFLGEAAMKIDPKLGREVSKEEALRHIRECQEAGLVHLIGRNKLDTFWLKVGPSHKLLTICNCCDCCCLWRILPHVSSKISSKVNKMPGVVISVEEEECIGCGTCKEVCFVKAIEIKDQKSVISDACRGCGRCVASCPQNAMTLTIDSIKDLDNSIEKIEALVDVT